jgi:60 kDa SS-A/Ro ribonucleoprotein
VYEQGHGERSDATWVPAPAVVEALDAAFYSSFEQVWPAGRRHLLGLDVSGSMSLGRIAGVPGLTPRMASAAMAMVTAATEPSCEFMAFTTKPSRLKIARALRLATVLKLIDRADFGGTDCALPMLWAMEQKLEVDLFAVYTDSETWFGSVHPWQALEQYRERTGIPAKLVVVGMTATEFSIANPADAGMLDVVGFDTASPHLIADFARQDSASLEPGPPGVAKPEFGLPEPAA